MSKSESDTDSEDEFEATFVRDFDAEADVITENLLPKKSSKRYNQAYNVFQEWINKNRATDLTENVVLVYFQEISDKYKPSTLWSIWSMLKKTLALKNQIDLDSYKKVKSLLQICVKRYKKKKSQVFKINQFIQFLSTGDDHHYLAIKAIAIFGVCGGLRSGEFEKILTSDVEDTGRKLIVDISSKDTKNDYPRTFIIGEELYPIVKNYINKRPTDMESSRFFYQLRNGLSIRQVIGKNKFAEAPKTIASYLGLDATQFTGHCFRRTAASFLSNSGATRQKLKEAFGWKSDAVADGYIVHSEPNRQEIYDGIMNIDRSGKSSSSSAVPLINNLPLTSACNQVNSDCLQDNPIAYSTVRQKSHVSTNKIVKANLPSESPVENRSTIEKQILTSPSNTSECQQNDLIPFVENLQSAASNCHRSGENSAGQGCGNLKNQNVSSMNNLPTNSSDRVNKSYENIDVQNKSELVAKKRRLDYEEPEDFSHSKKFIQEESKCSIDE